MDGAQVIFHARNLPPELKQDFKVWCVRRGISMQRAISAMMEVVVRGDDFAELVGDRIELTIEEAELEETT